VARLPERSDPPRLARARAVILKTAVNLAKTLPLQDAALLGANPHTQADGIIGMQRLLQG